MNNVGTLVFVLLALSQAIPAFPQSGKVTPAELELSEAIRQGNLSRIESALKSADVNGKRPDGSQVPAPLYQVMESWAGEISRGGAARDVENSEDMLNKMAPMLSAEQVRAMKENIRRTKEFLRGRAKCVDIAALLLDKGADPNLIVGQETILHRIAFLDPKATEAVAFLLRRGAKPSVPDRFGNTPLHYAVEKEKALPLVKLLLDSGADPNARNAKGYTVADFAVLSMHSEYVDELTAHGGRFGGSQEALYNQRGWAQDRVELPQFKFFDVGGMTHDGCCAQELLEKTPRSGQNVNAEARIYGEARNIKLNLLDEQNNVIPTDIKMSDSQQYANPIPNVEPDRGHGLGVVQIYAFKIPTKPFRVCLNAETFGGKMIRVVYPKLFTPGR
jgi:hypothetical protein